MAIVFRTAGAWGAGQGANLTPAQVDTNFYDVDQRIEEIENNPPEAIGITNITQSGQQFSIFVGETVYGPFDIPTTTFRYVGEWEASTPYALNDVVTVSGYGLYLVLDDHTSETVFDPDAENTDGALYLLLFGIGVDSIMTVSTTTLTLDSLDYVGKYVRLTHASGCAVTVPLNATVAFPIGTVVNFFGLNVMSLVEETDSPTFNYPPSKTPSTAEPNSHLSIVKVDTDEWDVGGYLADAGSA
jgi:hypothetical protein